MIYLFCERFLDLRYFLEILASNPSGLDIEFSQDGSWSVFKEERTGKTRELGSLASLSSILEITLSSPHAESKQICKKFSSVIGKRGSVPSRVPVINLTLDSAQSSCALSSLSHPPPPLRGPASTVPLQPPPLQAPPPPAFPPFPGRLPNTWIRIDNQTPPRR